MKGTLSGAIAYYIAKLMEWISDDYYVSTGVIFIGCVVLIGMTIFCTRFIDFDPDTDSAVRNLENKMLREAEFARNVFMIFIVYMYIESKKRDGKERKRGENE